MAMIYWTTTTMVTKSFDIGDDTKLFTNITDNLIKYISRGIDNINGSLKDSKYHYQFDPDDLDNGTGRVRIYCDGTDFFINLPNFWADDFSLTNFFRDYPQTIFDDDGNDIMAGADVDTRVTSTITCDNITW